MGAEVVPLASVVVPLPLTILLMLTLPSPAILQALLQFVEPLLVVGLGRLVSVLDRGVATVMPHPILVPLNTHLVQGMLNVLNAAQH